MMKPININYFMMYKYVTLFCTFPECRNETKRFNCINFRSLFIKVEKLWNLHKCVCFILQQKFSYYQYYMIWSLILCNTWKQQFVNHLSHNYKSFFFKNNELQILLNDMLKHTVIIVFEFLNKNSVFVLKSAYLKQVFN